MPASGLPLGGGEVEARGAGADARRGTLARSARPQAEARVSSLRRALGEDVREHERGGAPFS